MKFNKINNIIISSYVILLYMSTLSRADDASLYFWRNYINELLSDVCKDIVSLNFANSDLSTIDSDFITSSHITCLNLTSNHITRFSQNTFRTLPNLTTLLLFDNDISTFYLNGHENLKVLVINNYRRNHYSYVQQVVKKYENLEILSLSKNKIQDLQYSPSYQSYDLISPDFQNPDLRDYSSPYNHYRSYDYYDNTHRNLQHPQYSSSHQSYVMKSANLQDIPFPKLRILDLSENEITGNNFVTLLPSSGLGFLDLHENSLMSLKLHKKGEDVHTLILDNNNMEYITWQSNKSSLDLSSMKTLTYLSISNNRINDIQSNAFKDTDKLKFLNLSGNAINILYQEMFASLKYLNTVDLSSNRIENIPQFSNDLNISNLFLCHNQINIIPSNVFVQMPKLKKLLLGNNSLEWIDNKTFAQLPVLEELDLSTNKLSFLPEGWSESLISLKHLDLRENKFTSLESLSLTSIIDMCPPLIDLYLMKNPLKFLNIRDLKYLPQNLTLHLFD